MIFFIKNLVILVVLIVVINISFLKLPLGFIYYLIIGISFLILLIAKPKLKISFLFFGVLITILLSIVFNSIPSFFKPIERFIAFIIVLCLISPLVSSSVLIKFRKKLFLYLNYIILLMSVLSFFVLILGLNFRAEGRDDFNGIFAHSMILGPMSAIATIFSISKFYNSRNKINRIFFLSTSLLSFIACISSGSRIALLALFAGAIFFLFLNNKGKITSFLKTILLVSILLVASYPIWQKHTSHIIGKFRYGSEQGDIVVSRTYIWANRLLEFKSSPLIGIGFVSVNTEISDNFEKEEGLIEPGSSWLAILSMTGILGFTIIFIIFYKNYKFIVTNESNNSYIAFLGGTLALISIHMFAEGYVFSAGSGMFFYLWLLLGIIDLERKDYVSKDIKIISN